MALAISWISTVASGRGEHRTVWSVSPGMAWLVVGFLTWAGLSLLWAESASAGLAQMQTYLLVALLIPIVFTAVQSSRDVKAVAGAYVGGATIAAAYGLIATPSASGAQGAVNATEQLNRIAGTVGDPNVLASVLLVGAILAFALATTQRRSPLLRLLVAGAGILCLAVLVLTFSRGGLIALGAAVLAAPLVSRHKAAIIATGLLVLVCVVAYIGALAPAGAREHIVANDGGSGRTDIWKIGWRMVEAKPVIGIGVGNFQSSSIHYQIRPGAATVRTDLADNPSVAHNSFLELLAETGIVGLSLFLGVVLTALAAAFGATRKFFASDRNDLAVISGRDLRLPDLPARLGFLHLRAVQQAALAADRPLPGDAGDRAAGGELRLDAAGRPARRSRQERLIERFDPLDPNLKAPFLAPQLPCPRAQTLAQVGVSEQPRDRPGKRIRVAWGNQQSRLVIGDQLGQPAHPGRDQRQSRLHVLKHREWAALEIRTADGDIKSGEKIGDVITRAQEPHRVADPELPGKPPQGLELRSLSDQDHAQVGVSAAGDRERFDQDLKGLLGTQVPDAAKQRRVGRDPQLRPDSTSGAGFKAGDPVGDHDDRRGIDSLPLDHSQAPLLRDRDKGIGSTRDQVPV